MQAWLRRQLLAELRLEEARTGGHVVRDHRGWKTDEEYKVIGMWLVHVLPALDRGAAIAVVDEPQRRRFAFAVERRRPAPLGDVQRVVSESGERDAEWHDPLVAALQKVTLHEPGGSVALDGIGYRVEVCTRALSSVIEFTNPRTPGARRLEAAMVAALRSIGDIAGSNLIADYLAVWDRYAAGAALR